MSSGLTFSWVLKMVLICVQFVVTDGSVTDALGEGIISCPVAAFPGKCSLQFVSVEKDAKTKPLLMNAIACFGCRCLYCWSSPAT